MKVDISFQIKVNSSNKKTLYTIIYIYKIICFDSFISYNLFSSVVYYFMFSYYSFSWIVSSISFCLEIVHAQTIFWIFCISKYFFIYIQRKVTRIYNVYIILHSKFISLRKLVVENLFCWSELCCHSAIYLYKCFG